MKLPTLLFAGCLALLSPSAAPAVITVTGLTDKSYYADSVTFSIVNESGYTYTATLDGAFMSPQDPHTESRWGYHQLEVSKESPGDGITEFLTVRFIVKDVYRGGSSNTYPEAGIGRWTPLRSVDAPPDVLDAAPLTVVTPSSLPVDFSLPVIARLSNGASVPERLLGTMGVTGENMPAIFRIYRGAGSKVVKTPSTGGVKTLSCHLGTRTVTKSVNVVAAPAWQSLASPVAAARTFAPGSFVDVPANVTVNAGVALTFGSGCVVRCGANVEFEVLGTLKVNGSAAQPVVFAPGQAAPWGGIWVHGTGSKVEADFLILTGGGAKQSWITDHGMHSHKPQEPLMTWSDAATGYLNDSYIVENPSGQSTHAEDSTFTLRRCLLQRSISGGQIHNCTITWDQNHLVEMPKDETSFTGTDASDDNDGLYVDGGTTTVTDSVFGWVKDDGMDAGSGNTSNVSVSRCWYESCYHEGMAWSEGGTRTVRDCVSMNCGQGIECGFTGQGSGTPAVDALRVYSTGNYYGARYGDNYNWDYSGRFDLHDSLILFNVDDVFGRNWGSWIFSDGTTASANWDYVGSAATVIGGKTFVGYMNLTGGAGRGPSIVSVPQAEHSALATWNPADPVHLAKLQPFLTHPEMRSGFGIGQEDRQFPRAEFVRKITVRMDRPAGTTRILPWKLVGKANLSSTDEVTLFRNNLTMEAGRQAAEFSIPALPGVSGFTVITLVLEDTAAAVVTGNRTVTWVDLPDPQTVTPPTSTKLVTRSVTGWKYLAQTTAAPSTWTEKTFADTSWGNCSTRAGTSDTIATGAGIIPPNPSNGTRPYATVYFRKSFNVLDPAAFDTLSLILLRDDGAVVYLNGHEWKRDNMPLTGTINYTTEATNSVSGNTTTYNTFAGLLTTWLEAGTNVVAVEVHQKPIDSGTALTTSSDMSFDLELLGVPPGASAPPPELYSSRLGGNNQLFWLEPGLILETSSDLQAGGWLEMPDARPPFNIVPQQQRQFFRLWRP